MEESYLWLRWHRSNGRSYHQPPEEQHSPTIPAGTGKHFWKQTNIKFLALLSMDLQRQFNAHLTFSTLHPNITTTSVNNSPSQLSQQIICLQFLCQYSKHKIIFFRCLYNRLNESKMHHKMSLEHENYFNSSAFYSNTRTWLLGTMGPNNNCQANSFYSPVSTCWLFQVKIADQK